jgi:hypothetical protein
MILPFYLVPSLIIYSVSDALPNNNKYHNDV